jgi:ubiquinone/menaquinone biosynthesis C-methylase UbiE
MEEIMTTNDEQKVVEAVRERYGSIALDVLNEAASNCCTPQTQGPAGCCEPQATSSCCSTVSGEPCCTAPSGDGISENLYQVDELEGLPLKAALASLGCGNPTALAELRPGEVVLDLGSGGGIDVLLSARRVGPTGYAYGLDMTDAMLELARKNAEEAGADNVEFLKGDIAAIPLPSDSVDVIVSNCVINLAIDKAPVLREAFRVLKPGGRFAVSDIVIHGGLPADLGDTSEFRRDVSSWTGCIAGALTDDEYRRLLAAAGFSDIDLEVTRRYTLEQLGTTTPTWAGQIGEERVNDLVGRFASTFVRATKPLS